MLLALTIYAIVGSGLQNTLLSLVLAWWLSAFPRPALALALLGVNLTRNRVRDTLGPRLRV